MVQNKKLHLPLISDYQSPAVTVADSQRHCWALHVTTVKMFSATDLLQAFSNCEGTSKVVTYQDLEDNPDLAFSHSAPLKLLVAARSSH